MISNSALYLVATPIGNLNDVAPRAVDTLRQVDFVICEDSRRSGMLLKHLGIKKPFRVVHEHTAKGKEKLLIREIKSGRSAALITDAGTPLISDPGFELVREAIQEGIHVESIPGPTAFVNALIVSGLPTHSFTFIGYLPQKDKKRRDALQSLAEESRTLIFYESPYRVLKTLKDMLDIFGDRKASVSREMTKKFEETVRGSISEILAQVKGKKVLGEYTIVVAGNRMKVTIPSPSLEGEG
ncbi:MAG: 16S rRNA (cytidine(1402)-2'-O)-methyltransferase [Candidatus Omnitrophica bacterium]|nr:16S rRNA (cytidine(1402)-2'-O)-methyltransferase [Candidatus Omnitrophota bacterium]